jgi:hypothetical protein
MLQLIQYNKLINSINFFIFKFIPLDIMQRRNQSEFLQSKYIHKL